MTENHFHTARHNLLAQMEAGVAIIVAASPKTRSHDTEYPYRQNSDFYYLTGFNEDNAVLVLVKTAHLTQTFLFIEGYNADHALWNGARLSLEEAREKFRVDDVYECSHYSQKIAELLREHTRLYLDLYSEASPLLEAKKAAHALHHTRGVKHHIRTFIDVTQLIRTLRLIKTPTEIAMIRHAISITAHAHHEAMRVCHSGMKEYQLQASMSYVFLHNGALEQAYGAIVAGGNHANTLHYIDNQDTLCEGELVLIDAACEWQCYASDITRTFPINGTFSPAQREVYTAVLNVQLAVIEAIKPTIKREYLQTYSDALLCDALINLGILSGDRETLLESKAHKKYAPHGIGHWMGLDVHDPCPYVDEEGESIVLHEGMVMTIEPGLYFRADDESVPLKYRGIGIRIEDNILVTKEGYENLSAMIVKTIEDIETMCQQ